jgi:hypothetical protein
MVSPLLFAPATMSESTATSQPTNFIRNQINGDIDAELHKEIQTLLSKSHLPTYQYKFIWEN